MTTTKALAEARDDLLKDTREVFDANGSETPQVVRDVIEYVASWLDVFIGRLADAQAAEQAAGGGEAVAYPACPQEIVNAITAYGDARADQDANGAPTTSPMRLADCIGLIRAALSTRPELSDAAHDVIAERQRQIDAENWTPSHDDNEHENGVLAQAAACYARWCYEAPKLPNWVPTDWPWEDRWWKPSDPRRSLVKAAALILAELERLDRAALAARGGAKP